MSIVDEAISFLQQRKKTCRASELRKVLESFGFRVKDRKKAGHKTVSHSGLTEFSGFGYSAGHGSDDQVKPGYICTVISALKIHRDDLEKINQVHSHD